MAHRATLCAASYLIAGTSVPMETAVAFKSCRGWMFHRLSSPRREGWPPRGWDTRCYELPGASEDRRQEPREGMRAEGPGKKASHSIYIEMHNVSPQMRAIANRMRPGEHAGCVCCVCAHGRNPRGLTKRMNALFSRSRAAVCAFLHKIEEPSRRLRLPAWKQQRRSGGTVLPSLRVMS